MIRKGDYFEVEADYTQGASRYTNMAAAVWDFSMYDGNSFGFGKETDAVYGGTVAAGTATSLELTTTWAVNAAYTHFWNSQWKSTLWGSYRATSYSGLGNALLCTYMGNGNGAGGLGTLAVATPGRDNDWSIWGVGLRTQWAISSSFYMGLEVLYTNLQSASTWNGLVTLGAQGGKPGGLYTVEDQESWAVRLRVHRDFYP
jgi:Porin subfamily